MDGVLSKGVMGVLCESFMKVCVGYCMMDDYLETGSIDGHLKITCDVGQS